jgi:hypothetical protein
MIELCPGAVELRKGNNMNNSTAFRFVTVAMLLLAAFGSGTVSNGILGGTTTANAAAGTEQALTPSTVPAELLNNVPRIRIWNGGGGGGASEGSIIDVQGAWVKFKRDDGELRWINTNALDAQWELR